MSEDQRVWLGTEQERLQAPRYGNPGKAGCRIPALPPNGVTCIDVSIRGVFKNQHFGAEQLSSSAKELNFMFGALVMIIINIFPA